MGVDFEMIPRVDVKQTVRAWCVERSLEHARHNYVGSFQDIISLSKMIEDYVTDGNVEGAIQKAVEEGYSEGRFQVKEVLETEGFSQGLTLDKIFENNGWTRNNEKDCDTAAEPG
jgi:hypothetical protein